MYDRTMNFIKIDKGKAEEFTKAKMVTIVSEAEANKIGAELKFTLVSLNMQHFDFLSVSYFSLFIIGFVHTLR